MNILYFGPYLSDHYTGLSSRLFIESIGSLPGVNLTIRHMPVHDQDQDHKISHEFCRDMRDKSLLTNYDVIIQHASIDMLMTNTSSIAKKNIAIPIVSTNQALVQEEARLLSLFDHVLVDSKDLQDMMNLLGVSTTLIRPVSSSTEQSTPNGKVDLECHNDNFKFYFIGNYARDQQIIYKLLAAFNMAFRDREDISLILLLNDRDTQNTAKACQDAIQLTRDQLLIKQKLSIEKVVVQSLNLAELNIIHEALDVLLDINDENDSNLNVWMARDKNNKILFKKDFQHTRTPIISSRAIADYAQQKYSILTESLVSVMRAAVTNKHEIAETTSTIPTTTIKTILCL